MLRGKDCRKGDKVRFLHEKGEGVVTNVTREFVYVDQGDGFELPMLHKDVIIMERAPKETVTDDIPASGSSHEQDYFTPAESKPVHKHSMKSGVQIPRGLYFAFAPDNQDVLLAGDLKLYLINYTKFSAMYVLYVSDSESVPRYSGILESASAILIDTIERKESGLFRKGIFQCMFTESGQKGIAAPFYTHIEIKPERFLKEELYVYNPVISLYCITSQLMRLEEMKWLQQSIGKGKGEVDAGFSKIIEEDSLIRRYQTAPGEAEVDLHLHSMFPDSHKIDDGLKLKKQIDFCRQIIDSAIEHKYRRLILIHGVGVGILKIEIHKLLRSYDQLQFRDAPIAKYGIGATEVIIEQ